LNEERKLPAFLSPFAFRSFRLLWTGAFLSSIGTWVQDTAMNWYIHTRLGNPVYLGLRTFAAEAPLMAFMLVGGVAADRMSRRGILVTSQVFQMSMAVALAVFYALDLLGIGAILVIAFLTGLAQSQSAPTYQAVLPTLVSRERIPNAVALNSLQFNLSRAIGPAVAGLLLAGAGTGVCFVANALSFLAVIFALARIDLPPVAATPQETLGASLKAGLRHVASSPTLSVLTLLGALGSFLAFPLITYLPVIAGDVLRTGARGYSLLLTSLGLGAIVGAVATAQRGHVPRRGRLLLTSFVGYGGAALVASLSRWQSVSMVFLFVAGLCLTTAFSTVNSLVQENAPDEMRGRVVSIFGLAFRGGNPLGSLVAGALVKGLGAPLVLSVFAGALALAASLMLLRHARLREL
jgi:predicted MFS family arabinose efflux permease